MHPITATPASNRTCALLIGTLIGSERRAFSWDKLEGMETIEER